MAEGESRLTKRREISRSGIATVWEAYDAGLDRKVLVKSIHPQFARESDLRERFEREARAIARLSHPNVVQVYDLRAGEDELSIILEYVDGVSLRQLLKDHGALPPEVAVTIAADILSGLEQAHAAGIVHRDLKPENVLVSQRGEVKISDFGLAHLRDLPTVTQEGMVVGTPSYMAPEQASGGETTASTDLFAAGLILFEMLTGSRVIEGATLGEALQNVLRYSQPHLEAHGERIPAGVAPVLRTLLEKQPDRRYRSAAEARGALTASIPGGLLPRGLIADFLSGRPFPKPGAVRPQRRSRSRVLQSILMAVLLVVVGGTGYLLREWHHQARLSLQDTTSTSGSTIDTLAIMGPPGEGLTTQEPSPDTIVEVIDHPDTVPKKPEHGNHRTPQQPVSPPEPARIEIATNPWASVYLGDSLIGNTPMGTALTVPPGSYNITMINPEIGFPVVRQVDALPGEISELKVNLYDWVARIRIASVKPWADVYIDGAFVARTPTSRTIFRPLGSHTITLKNPDYPEYNTEISFRQSDPVYEVRVDLTQI